jgi:hypothetical protein
MESWTGLTVSEVLASCGTPYDEIALVDEPPGKLRAVELECRTSVPPRRVVLELRYHPGLFSPTRAWTRELVEAQVVSRVLSEHDFRERGE